MPEKAEFTLIKILSKTRKFLQLLPCFVVWLLANHSTTQCRELEHFHYYLCRQLKGGGMEIKMHIWTIDNWKHFLDCSDNRRTGLRFRYEPTVNPEVKNACKYFAQWLRSEYYFPLRVPVYIKDKTYIKARDGEHVVGTFLGPYDYSAEPYIKIAVGDYLELKNRYGRDDALATILTSIAHELTHYYQWINNLELTDIGRERQATRYARFIITEYAMTREHP